ncbi:MAG TPA: hypothetical protein VLT34_06735, partial [Arthrobacter sp.]|nr:hypothetical protein [Arthrobacter sp.]
EQGILGKIADAPDRAILADGFSCRTQVADLAGRDSRHLVQIIAEALEGSGGPSLHPERPGSTRQADEPQARNG